MCTELQKSQYSGLKSHIPATYSFYGPYITSQELSFLTSKNMGDVHLIVSVSIIFQMQKEIQDLIRIIRALPRSHSNLVASLNKKCVEVEAFSGDP